MAHINNIWYYESNGDSWCATGCELDREYRMPYKNGDTRYLQVSFSNDYAVNRVWFTLPNGTRLFDILGITDFQKVIGDNDFTTLSFLIPELGDGDCPSYQSGTTPACIFNIVEYLTFLGAGFIDLYNDYVAGTGGVTMAISYNGGAFLFPPTYPLGWSEAPDNLFYIPCPPDGATDVDIALNFYIDDVLNTQTDIVPIAYIDETDIPIYTTVKCFHFEIPLVVDGNEVDTLVSEPFECGGCGETLVINGDYCLSTTDIFRQKVFDLTTLTGTVTGDLTAITNEMRIQAVTKSMPPQTTAIRNLRCNNFKSKATERFKIQGARTDFPPSMGKEIASVFAAKKVYIEDVEYIPTSDTIFTERGVQGYGQWKLDAEMNQCEQTVVFDCSCVIPPVNCDEDPVTGGMLVLPAPNITEEDYGVNRAFIYARFYPVTGVPPYTYSNWTVASANAIPDSSIEVFDDTRDFNIFKRTDYNPCIGCLAILVDITDSRGCTYLGGINVDMDDLRCVEDGGFFEIGTVTDTTIQVINVAPAGASGMEYSLDGVNYVPTGLTPPSPFTITGLTADTEYSIFVKLICDDTSEGIIGPAYVTTLP